MLAFPMMLVDAAKEAGMAVPDEVEKWSEQKEKFPHFTVFCVAQLGQSMPYPTVHYDNAKVVASLSDAEVKTITHEQLHAKGFQVGRSR